MSNVIFNPAKFLYYNPEFAAYSNIVTNQQAVDWAASNDTTQYIYNDSSIPFDFDAEVFIADFKNNIDASVLNATIKAAMSNEGFTIAMLNQRAKFASTIFKRVRVESQNTLKFNFQAARPEDQFTIRPQALQVGDRIKLRNENTRIFDTASVTSIIDNETFTVSNPKRVFDNVGDIYTLISIELYDLVRLARINYLRGLNPPPQVPNPDAIGFIDPEFNPDLYRLLYEDAREKSDREAFFDYINRRDNGDKRIGRVDDIPINSNVFEPAFDYLNVNYRFTLEPTAGFEWGQHYVYGISQDHTTTHHALNQNYDRLMTEWAVKKYIDRKYDELAIFNNVIVNGETTFNGPVSYNSSFSVEDIIVRRDLTVGRDTTLSNNLQVLGPTELTGGLRVTGSNIHYIENVEIHNAHHTGCNDFHTDAYFRSNVFIDGYSVGPRIGVGPAIQIDYNDTATGLYNARLKNTQIFETLNVGSNLPPNSVAVNVNGFIIADNVNYVSDARVKRIITHTSNVASSPIDIIKNIESVKFVYNNAMTKERLGFVADEVEEYLPSAVKRIREHELDNMNVKVHVDNLHRLSLLNDAYMNLDVNDELHIKETGEWLIVAGTVRKADLYIDIEHTVDATMIGTTLTIDRIKYKNVKTIDYPSLVATMWSALRILLSDS